ncbi:MAG: hypothetical protein EOO92_00990 [Pedobacter sp.]|nr:MAG: hypothetical protein EOO92_00990 [Pedobacter sp.]
MKKLMGLIGMLSLGMTAAFAQNTNTVPFPEVAVNATPKVHVAVNTTINNNASADQDDDGPMRSKTFTKSFTADQIDKITLINLYGSIQIKIWDKREVQADIDIKSYSNTDGEAQKLLDEVTIEASKSGDQIIFKTKMDQQGRNWGRGSSNGKKWVREVRINYVVYMPASNALTLSQSYGSVTMGDLSGALYAKVQYGNFTAQNLSNTNNHISVQYGNCNVQSLNAAVVKQQYGSGLTIGTVNRLDLNAQYSGVKINTIKGNAVIKQQYGSGLTIGSVDDLNLTAQYANVNIGTIKGNAVVKQQYNNLTIGSVGKLELNSQYTNATITSLNGDGKFDMSYNKLTISEVGNGAKSLGVDGRYVNISLGFAENYHADFDVHTSYAGFKYADRVTAKQLGDTKNYSSTKDYTGKIGNGGASVVKISSGYGSVNFK